MSLFVDLDEETHSGGSEITDNAVEMKQCIRRKSNSSSIKEKCLDVHNYYRCLHGLKPLRHNDSLATSALRHVQLLIQKDVETRNAFKVYMAGKHSKKSFFFLYLETNLCLKQATKHIFLNNSAEIFYEKCLNLGLLPYETSKL